MAAMSIFRAFSNGGARGSQLLGSGMLQNACKSRFSEAAFSRAVSSSTKSENLSGIMQGKKTEKKQAHGIGPTARMRIVMKSANPNFPRINSGPYTSKVSLPMKRKLYTVLRSPHIDKKSREQFEMRIYKEIIDIETTTSELAKKLFWFKRQKLIGAQYGFIFNYKTRLQLPRPAPSTTADEDSEESLSDLEEKVKHLVQATVGSETFGEGTEEQ